LSAANARWLPVPQLSALAGKAQFLYLEWWRAVPQPRNGRSIYKPIETAYLYVDYSDYGWGAVLNENPSFIREALVCSIPPSTHNMKLAASCALAHAIKSFLPQLRGCNVLLHVYNIAVSASIEGLHGNAITGNRTRHLRVRSRTP
jgi:hypothetical protein